MKLLIFSDSHLSARFDPAQYNYLHWIISHADKVVINGDFWDRDLCTFDQFVNSDWRKLFPLLLSKHTTYIYGNHDHHAYSDERVNLFSTSQGQVLDINADGRKLHIEHGNKIAFIHDRCTESKLHSIWASDRDLLSRMVSDRIFNAVFGHYNREMAAWAEQNLPADTTLVCGHTHIQQNDIRHQFVNSGFNKYGYGQYLLVDNGQLKLMHVHYAAKWKYFLFINRDLFFSRRISRAAQTLQVASEQQVS